MRHLFTADWAFGIKGAIENVVRNAFPQDLRTWPLLHTFNFEAYSLPNNYMVIILKDKLSGVIAGPGEAKPFPYQDYPKIPPSPNDIELWQFYLRSKFNLRNEDAAVIIPVYDSGKSSAAEDYKMFSAEEQLFWDQQIKYVISNYKTKLQAAMNTSSSQPINITYNVSGSSNRVNIDSIDSSFNIINTEATQIFSELRKLLEKIDNSTDRTHIAHSVDAMEATVGTRDFISNYQQFMSFISDHIAVFTPLLPLLAKLLA